MGKEITRKELYSLREATHLISFGLKPGDEKASALADELTSEIINKGLVALQTKEYSYSQEQLTDSNGKPKCLFGIFKHPTLKYYKRKQIGNKTYFEPISNPFIGIIGLSSSPLLNRPSFRLSYRFSFVIKNFEDIFVGKQELDNLDLNPPFEEVWEANKNRSLEKNDAENIFDKLQNWDLDLVYNTLDIIYKNGNWVEDYEMTSANLPLAKEIFPIIKLLHEASIIYLDYYRQNSQKIYFWKDSNFQELRSLVRQYQVLKNPKNYEFDVELEIRLQKESKELLSLSQVKNQQVLKNNGDETQLKSELILKHRGDEIVLKDISKMPYYLLKLLLTFPGVFYHEDNLNTAIKALYKKSGQKDGYREIKGISKELHNALRISDKETLKQVENICKMYGKTSLSDLLFKIVGNSIAYIPFKKR